MATANIYDAKMAFADKLGALCMAERMSDVRFVYHKGDPTKERIFHAHRVVIALGSSVLETMFDFNQRQQQLENNAEVEMDAWDVPPEAFEQLLNFLYLKPVTLTGETVFTVMATARRYMVDDLVKECVAFVTANTRPEDLLSVFTSCLVLDEPELQDWCADQIMKDTAAVLRSPDFLKLSPATMDVLLRAPAISVEEIEIFKALLLWGREQCRGRGLDPNNPAHLRSVLDPLLPLLLRFGSFSLKDFATVVIPSGVPLPFTSSVPRRSSTLLQEITALSTTGLKGHIGGRIQAFSTWKAILPLASYHTPAVFVGGIPWLVEVRLNTRDIKRMERESAGLKKSVGSRLDKG